MSLLYPLILCPKLLENTDKHYIFYPYISSSFLSPSVKVCKWRCAIQINLSLLSITLGVLNENTRALCSKYRYFDTKSATFSVICMQLDLYKMPATSTLQCLLVDAKYVSVLLHWYLLNCSCSYHCLIDARKYLSVAW